MTWNINGIRSLGDFGAVLGGLEADIICVQVVGTYAGGHCLFPTGHYFPYWTLSLPYLTLYLPFWTLSSLLDTVSSLLDTIFPSGHFLP